MLPTQRPNPMYDITSKLWPLFPKKLRTIGGIFGQNLEIPTIVVGSVRQNLTQSDVLRTQSNKAPT